MTVLLVVGGIVNGLQPSRSYIRFAHLFISSNLCEVGLFVYSAVQGQGK